MLLTGPAGVGKTHFAQSLAQVFATARRQIDFASQSSGFALSGLDRRWSSGAIGQVVSAFLASDSIDPLFFLDEIDKTGEEAKSSPLGPLYALLERASAAHFRDEYLDMPVDASHIHWIAAANTVAPIPGPLLSRFQRFEIPSPTPAQMRQIAQGLFQKMLQGMPAPQPTMPEQWMAQIENCSVRVAQRALEQALGRSALRAEVEGQAVLAFHDDDMPTLQGPKPRRPAFY
jgi:ATP-dependent Lon protease